MKHSDQLRKAYYKELGDKASTAMYEKVRHGDFPGCPPVGYRNNPYGHEVPIIVDGTLAPLVRQSFELAATGKYSLRELLRIMTEKGLVSRRGRPMGISSFYNMLNNPFYTGRIRYYDELLPGRHSAIVDDDLFIESKISLRKRNKRTIP